MLAYLLRKKLDKIEQLVKDTLNDETEVDLEQHLSLKKYFDESRHSLSWGSLP